MEHDPEHMAGPSYYGYRVTGGGRKFQLSEKGLEMLKVAFCLAFAAWMSACVMMAVYSGEIARFMVERMQ